MKLTKPTNIRTIDQLKASYDRIYTLSPIRETDEHYRWIIGLLKPMRGGRLLDIACGAGFLLEQAAKAGLIAYGIDISEVAVRIAQERVPQADIQVGDAENLPYPDASFDYVTNLGSLEHFLNPNQGVREMVRVLRPDGRALLLLPNSFFLVYIWHVLTTGGIGRETPQELDRLATRKEWQDLLENNGLQVVTVHKYNLKNPAMSWRYRLIQPFIPFNLSYSFVFICRK